LPVSVTLFEEEVNIHRQLTTSAKEAIEKLLKNKPDIFVFFQEQDPLMVILSCYYARSGSSVLLCQDGLKPYVNLKFHSMGLLKENHQQNMWLKTNDFHVSSWLSPIFSKKYAFLHGITKVLLTCPEAYENWNNKQLEKINFLPLDILNPILKRLFKWEDSLLPDRDGIIFYMNQPMHDDGVAEAEILKKMQELHPKVPIYLKLHPLTDDIKLQQYQNLGNLHIIKSEIPAELFIMNLKNSIIVSINSTSMLLNNPENKFYYLNKNLLKNRIKRLKRLQLKRIPADHITLADSLKDIKF